MPVPQCWAWAWENMIPSWWWKLTIRELKQGNNFDDWQKPENLMTRHPVHHYHMEEFSTSFKNRSNPSFKKPCQEKYWSINSNESWLCYDVNDESIRNQHMYLRKSAGVWSWDPAAIRWDVSIPKRPSELASWHWIRSRYYMKKCWLHWHVFYSIPWHASEVWTHWYPLQPKYLYLRGYGLLEDSIGLSPRNNWHCIDMIRLPHSARSWAPSPCCHVVSTALATKSISMGFALMNCLYAKHICQ